MNISFNWRIFSDPAPSSSETTISICSDVTVPYVDEEETENDVYRIDLTGAHGDITIETEFESDAEFDGNEPQELWTHTYIPDGEPAPYAESLGEEGDDNHISTGEDVGCEELVLPPVSKAKPKMRK